MRHATAKLTESQDRAMQYIALRIRNRRRAAAIGVQPCRHVEQCVVEREHKIQTKTIQSLVKMGFLESIPSNGSGPLLSLSRFAEWKYREYL